MATSTFRSRKNLTLNNFTSTVPPPSPIPTARGSRSASNTLFTDYLNRTLKIPDLSFPDYLHRSLPLAVDRQSIISQNHDSIKLLLRSAAEFGIFRVSGHGISTEELRSVLHDADDIFLIPDARRNRKCYLSHGSSDEFLWPRFENAAAKKIIGSSKYRTFSLKINKVAQELNLIAEELAQVISDSSTTKKMIQHEIQSVFSIHRWNDNKSVSIDEESESTHNYSISLHLPVDEREFPVHSHRGRLSFTASPDAIIVTVGKQLEDWSNGEFKQAFMEFPEEPNLNRNLPTYSIEFKCSPSAFTQGFGNIHKKISLPNQILLLLLVLVLYQTILQFVF
ncbi:uncharacterized protein LOC124938971 [Impatiens glandulifera]|uniref:uncharacterized protein LOC124938971 n=1 Tax=Impatiens glandulifera TaxID=253017 RepID=UPI001FB0C0CE|nr:uncharacterized protein LOC124938971 [Impatiens glandulifera]